MSTLVDTNVLLDIATRDPVWALWSLGQLDAAAMTDPIGALLRWLESARTTSARFLRMKPVVFIDSPVALTVAMGDVLWRGG